MRMSSILVASFFIGLSTSATYAAGQLDGIEGKVLVNSGSGYVTVAQSATLKVGDRIMVRPGSSAKVTFADGCTVPVKAGSVITIGRTSPCKFKAQGNQGPGGYEPFIIGGAAAAGIGVALYNGSKDENGFISVP